MRDVPPSPGPGAPGTRTRGGKPDGVALIVVTTLAIVGVIFFVSGLGRLGGRVRDGSAREETSMAPASGRGVSPISPARSGPRSIPPNQGMADAPDMDRWVRAPTEWQGMLPDPELEWACGEILCAKARACVDGRCVPCVSDEECEAGERCVLQHCVPSANVECVTRADCDAPDELCLLSGLSGSGGRSNADMVAYCLSPGGGVVRTREENEAMVAAEVAKARKVRSPAATPTGRAVDLLRERRDARRAAAPGE